MTASSVTPTPLKVGDEVSVDFADLEDKKMPSNEPQTKERDKACVIGVLGKIDGDKAFVVEVHAFHYLWGGSSVSRGDVHEVELSALERCPRQWRHIVTEQAKKNKVRNVLDELLAPVRP
jgi:hypothetical protein